MVVLEKFSFLSTFIESEKKQRNYEMRVSIPIAWKFAGCYKWKCNGRNVIIQNKVILNKSVLGDHYCFHQQLLLYHHRKVNTQTYSYIFNLQRICDILSVYNKTYSEKCFPFVFYTPLESHSPYFSSIYSIVSVLPPYCFEFSVSSFLQCLDEHFIFLKYFFFSVEMLWLEK